MRDLYRQSGIFRAGLFALAGSLAVAVLVIALVRPSGEQAVSAQPAETTGASEATRAERLTEPIQSSPLPNETEPEETEPEQPEEPEPRTTASSAPEKPQARPEPAPEPRRERPEPQRDPEPEPERPQSNQGLPLRGDDWPGAGRREIEAAGEPREYGWERGAVMTLSSPALDLRNAPVFGDDSRRNLDRGIVHVPETSLPWERGRQKNVYLAAHRLGWPGTGSRMIFYNLDRLRKGDRVSVEDRRGDVYRYRVTGKFVVDPLDSWVMGEVRGKDLLTLQTCTPIPSFHKRLIVRAERI